MNLIYIVVIVIIILLLIFVYWQLFTLKTFPKENNTIYIDGAIRRIGSISLGKFTDQLKVVDAVVRNNCNAYTWSSSDGSLNGFIIPIDPAQGQKMLMIPIIKAPNVVSCVSLSVPVQFQTTTL